MISKIEGELQILSPAFDILRIIFNKSICACLFFVFSAKTPNFLGNYSNIGIIWHDSVETQVRLLNSLTKFESDRKNIDIKVYTSKLFLSI